MFTIISQLSADHTGVRRVPVYVTDSAPVTVDVDLHATFALRCAIGQTYGDSIVTDGADNASVSGVVTTVLAVRAPLVVAPKVTVAKETFCTSTLHTIHQDRNTVCN